jgi:iron-sulfur cluster assembly protein
MITLTDRAQQQVVSLLNKRKMGVGIRIGVKTTGCSGLAYTLEYIDKNGFDPLDEQIDYPNFVVRISCKAVPYLKGLEVDYVTQGLKQGFEFRNPNERDLCGCGESFRV